MSCKQHLRTIAPILEPMDIENHTMAKQVPEQPARPPEQALQAGPRRGRGERGVLEGVNCTKRQESGRMGSLARGKVGH